MFGRLIPASKGSEGTVEDDVSWCVHTMGRNLRFCKAVKLQAKVRINLQTKTGRKKCIQKCIEQLNTGYFGWIILILQYNKGSEHIGLLAQDGWTAGGTPQLPECNFSPFLFLKSHNESPNVPDTDSEHKWQCKLSITSTKKKNHQDCSVVVFPVTAAAMKINLKKTQAGGKISGLTRTGWLAEEPM